MKKKVPENIIINFPTNLGDVIMGLPVLDRLRFNYPKTKITAIVSPVAKEFLLKNNFINEVVAFDKLWKKRHKARFALDLRGKYDLAVDLKNSFLPVILGVKQRTSFLRRFPKGTHARKEYLNLLDKIAPKKGALKHEFAFSPEEDKKWKKSGIKKSIFVACSSHSNLKKYPYEYLKEVMRHLSSKHSLVVLGLEKDRNFYKDTLSLPGVIDLTGKTSMNEVFCLLKKYASMLLCVDSSIMHAASYLDLPIVAIFGPTEVKRYGPWSKESVVLRKENIACSPCGSAKCGINIECMYVEPAKVIEAVEKTLKRSV